MTFLAVYSSKDGYHAARMEQETRASSFIEVNAENILKTTLSVMLSSTLSVIYNHNFLCQLVKLVNRLLSFTTNKNEREGKSKREKIGSEYNFLPL